MPIQQQELKDFIVIDGKDDTIHKLEIPNPDISISKYNDLVQDAKELSKDSKSSDESLQKIISSGQLLSKVKKDLGDIIDAVVKNPSYLTEWARKWGEMPTWQKYSGLAVPVSIFIGGIGMFAIIPAIVGGFLVVIYTAAGFVLEDHFNKTMDITDTLKKGIFGLADVLGFLINALEKIRVDLSNEIDKFKVQNMKLETSVSNLTDQVSSLTSQTALLKETEKLLSQDIKNQEINQKIMENNIVNSKSMIVKLSGDLESVKKSLQDLKEENDKYTNLNKSLESSIDLFKETVKFNEEQLIKSREESKELHNAYKFNEEKLSLTTKELDSVKTKMTLELDKANNVSQSLKGALDLMTCSVIENEENRKIFQEKINSLLSDGGKNFVEINCKFQETQKELAATKEELSKVRLQFEESHKVYERNLNRHDEQIVQLSQLNQLIQPRAAYVSLADQFFKNRGYSTQQEQSNLKTPETAGQDSTPH